VTGSEGDRHSFREIGPVPSLRTPAFEFTEVRGHGEVAEHDRRLEELARRAAAEAVSDRLLVLTPVVGALAEMSLNLGDDEDLLEDARANAQSGAYDLALEQLSEYLRIRPEHQEARYLRAFCMYRLDGQDQVEALRILRPLRDEPMADELRERVRDLRRELRRRLTPLEITAYAQTVRSDPHGALDRAKAFLELAPEEGSLSHLVALGQARDGALEQALDTATRGAAEADVDKEQVSSLARRLLLPFLCPVAEPAVTAFKERDPRRARAELSRMAPRWRHNAVVDDFDAILALWIARPNSTSPPMPNLPADRAEDVYSLIAESDGQTAAALMQAGLAHEAERLLARVLALIPGFRWLNFLYAACLLRLGRDPERAATCAEIARRDPTITQAGELLEAIRGWQEATVINPAVAEYVAAMKSVSGGVSSGRLAALRTRLLDLQRELPTLRGAARTERGGQAVQELGKAIGQRLAEIADAMVVSELYDRYDAIMSTVKGGVPDAAAADRLARSLDELAARIKDGRRGTGKNTGGDSFEELAKLVSARRSEVERVKTGLKVSALVRRFNELAELTATSFGPRDVYTMRTRLISIRDDAQKLRRDSKRALDPRDLELLDELIAAIMRTRI
jgi:tetratricopeptide (TPR) repeat protein